MEKRADESEKQSAELRASLAKSQISLEGNSRALERIDPRLEGLSKQLTALADQASSLKQANDRLSGLTSDQSSGLEQAADRLAQLATEHLSSLKQTTNQLSSLKQMIESGISEQIGTNEELRMINSGLAEVEAQLTALSRRADVGETGLARLSALAESLGTSVAALKTDSKDAAHRVATLEPRILWRIEELETLVSARRAHVDRVPAGDPKGAARVDPPRRDNAAAPGEREKPGEDRAGGATPSARS